MSPVDALDRWNARHPWSHNDHYHAWLLRRLPDRRGAALDVGCGRGELAERLAARFDTVTGVDPDPAMAAASRRRFAGRPQVTIRCEDFLATEGRYDAITMVASLHHLPLEPALAHARELLTPGGRLLVVGLAAVDTVRDAAIDVVSSLLNPMVGLAKHPRAERGVRTPPPCPVRDPAESHTQLRAAADRLLPGAVVRHRLFWRYTLCWEKPA